MHVQLADRDGGLTDLVVNRNRRLTHLTPHDLNDIEAELARRKAMSRRCDVTSGEHTCVLPPKHTCPERHLCRACTYEWPPEAGQEAAA